MFLLVNEGLLTQMLARFKTGKLYISDFNIEKSREQIQRQSEPAKDKCRSMAIANRPKIAKSSFAASVSLSPPIQGFALASSIKLLFSISIMIKQIVEKYWQTRTRTHVGVPWYYVIVEVHCGLWRCWAMSNFFFQIFLYSYVFFIL